jgi:hypothetical protein
VLEEPLPEYFRNFADVFERDGGVTYATICRAVADDDDVLSLLEDAPLPQRRPLLLLAAVHFLLLSGVDHPLAAFYETVGVERGLTPEHTPTGDVAVAFSDFCRQHRSELQQLVATRATQTNEVGRCSGLLPGLCHIAALYQWRQPLSLLDLGTSAGLNLLFDDYGYTYRAAQGGAVRTAGAAQPRLQLECSVRDDVSHLPELRLPVISERVGLDLAPVDPFSDNEARWLLACLWPDNMPRFARLRAALENVRASSHPPRLVRGDMLTDLSSVIAAMAGTGPLVVFHSWVAAYLDEGQQRDLGAQVAALSIQRPVHHLYSESPVETPGLPTPPSPIHREGPDLATALVHVLPGGGPAVRLADTHPHGYWIRWWPTS